MDELYDFLKESDSTMMKGISREEFKQTFGTSKGLDNLYSYLSNETPLVKGIDKETFISTFGSQQSRG
ncbi:hypothetical protein KC660_04730, partial [Candidatus Dojkabacteria bacterium]|nr:hypothetical protein [Candidatus Dojkabacteria bacterium]